MDLRWSCMSSRFAQPSSCWNCSGRSLCPICSREFVTLNGDCHDLPSNVFVEKLLAIKAINVEDEASTKLACDVCSGQNNTAESRLLSVMLLLSPETSQCIHLLPRDAMLPRLWYGTVSVCLSVCLFVCLSQVEVLSKPLNMSPKQRHIP